MLNALVVWATASNAAAPTKAAAVTPHFARQTHREPGERPDRIGAEVPVACPVVRHRERRPRKLRHLRSEWQSRRTRGAGSGRAAAVVASAVRQRHVRQGGQEQLRESRRSGHLTLGSPAGDDARLHQNLAGVNPRAPRRGHLVRALPRCRPRRPLVATGPRTLARAAADHPHYIFSHTHSSRH